MRRRFNYTSPLLGAEDTPKRVRFSCSRLATLALLGVIAVAIALLVTQLVIYNRVNNLSLDLTDLNDVESGGPLSGQALVYNGTFWVPSGNIDVLDDLSDVEVPNPSNNSYLVYNGTKWVATTPNVTTNDLLAGLLDVTLTMPQEHEILIYTSSGQWVNGIVKAASVDSMEVQLRILGVCPGQSYVRRIFENGTVLCDNTIANNVIGSDQIIAGSVTDEDIDSTLVQQRVTGQCLGDGNYVKYVNQDGSVQCATALAPMSVGSSQIIDGSVSELDIDSTVVQERVTGLCAVSGESITSVGQDGSVTCSGVVAAGAVGPLQLQNDAVTTDKIASGAVTSDSILDGTITSTDMSAQYQIGVANGIVPLDGMGLISPVYLPAITVSTVTVCADIPCRDAISPIQEGDVVKVLDSDGLGNPNTYIWDGAAFQSIMVPPGNVALNDLLDVTIGGVPGNGQVLTYNSGTMMWEPSSVSMETASNLGTGGQGLYAMKVGTDLQFYSLIAGSSKVTVGTPVAGNVPLDVVPGSINHNDLANIPANTHIDHSAVLLVGANGILVDGASSADLTSSRTLSLNATLSLLLDVDSALAPSDDQILAFDAGMGLWKAGNKITGANVGTLPGHPFLAKVGDVLQFRQIGSSNGKLSVTNSGNDIVFTLQEGSVDHDALLNFVGSEHVDHSMAKIAVTDGITVDGGTTAQDTTTTRTLGIDANVIQRRVVGACSMGGNEAITAVNFDGSVVCTAVAGSLDALSDVSVPAPANGEVLAFNGMSGQWEASAVPASSDTASNLGVGGEGLFAGKVMGDFQFYSIIAGSTKLSISAPSVGNIALDVVPANIHHGALLGYVSDEHIDHTSVTFGVSGGLLIDGGTSPLDITASRSLGVNSAVIQSRVIGTCPAGSAIRSIDAAGGVVCQDDSGALDELSDVTITMPTNNQALFYFGGNWVNGVLGAASVDSMQIQERVTGSCPAQSYMRVIAQDGTVTCDNTIANNVVGSSQIIDGSITDGDIDSSLVQERVTGACLGDGNYIKGINSDGTVLCGAVLAPDSVDSTKIVDGSIEAVDVDSTSIQERVIGACTGLGEAITAIGESGNVTCSDAVALLSVGTDQLINDAVTSAKILDNTIQEVDMSAAYKIGVANGIVPLDGAGLINPSFLPPVTINTVTVCADIACRDAISPIQVGDVVKVLDSDGMGNPNTYIWDGAAFQSIMVPPGNVGLNDLLDVSVASPANGEVLTYNSVSMMWEASATAGSITASNLGVGGQGLFSAKVGSDLQFFSLIAGSSKLSIAAPSAGNIALDVVTSGINHDDLANIPTNDHVDHSTVLLTGGLGITIDGGASGDITASRTIALSASLADLTDVSNVLAPSNDQILEYNSGSGLWVAGDKITGANVGTGAGTIFISKVGNQLQFRQIAAGSSKVSVSNNGNDIDIDVQEGNVDHDALLNFVANEHVDHTSVLLAVGGGLLIDGDTTPQNIAVSRTLSVNTSVIQARITGSCPPGSSIRAIDASGGVTCETDDTGAGFVTGPGPTVTDNAIARFDGTGGLTIQESLVSISDTGAVSGATTYNGVAIDTVAIVGGIGLTNMGTSTLESTVQIDLDIGSLSDLSPGAVDFENDRILVYDTSTSLHYKMPFSDLPLFEKPPLGEIYYFDLGGTVYSVTTSSPTTTGLNNMVEVQTPGTILSPGNRGFSAGLVNGRIRYTGTAAVTCHTAATISISSSNNANLVFALGTTDTMTTTIEPNSRVTFLTSASSVHSTAIHAYIPLNPNDEISLFVGSVSSTETARIHGTNIFLMCIRL